MNTLFLSLLISLVAGIFISGLLYYRKKQTYSRALTALLFALRGLGFGLILFIIIAPFIPYSKTEQVKPVVAFLVDNSASMVSAGDSAASLEKWNADFQNKFGEIKDAESIFYRFDEKLETGAVNFDGKATDISQAIQAVQQRTDPERLAAIVLVSDGIVNRGFNPLYTTENTLVPVFTVATGDSAKQKDIAISQLRAPEYVFRGDDTFFECTISAENMAGYAGKVELKRNGQLLQDLKLQVQNNSFAQNVTFTIPATTPGLFTFQVQVQGTADEQNTANNAQQIFVEVIENRKKIAIVSSAPHPDVQALKESLKKVDAYEIESVNLAQTTTMPSQTEMAVIFVQNSTNAEKLNAALKNFNGPLWMVVSPQARSNTFQESLGWISKVGQPQGIALIPNFNSHFGIFKLTDQTQNALKKLGKLQVFTGDVRTQTPAEALLFDSQNKGLALYGTTQNRRWVVFNFSGLWPWRMADFKQNNTHKHVDEWLHLTAQYLTSQGNSNRLKLNYKKRLALGDEVDILADVFDASFERTALARVSMQLKNDAGEEFAYDFNAFNNQYKAELGALKQGKYTFVATATLGNETLRNNGAFFIENIAIEQLRTRADFTLLAQLSEGTGGHFYTENDLNTLHTDLLAQPFLSPIEKMKTDVVSLIDLQWLFFVALILLATEWVLRRYFGSI